MHARLLLKWELVPVTSQWDEEDDDGGGDGEEMPKVNGSLMRLAGSGQPQPDALVRASLTEPLLSVSRCSLPPLNANAFLIEFTKYDNVHL